MKSMFLNKLFWLKELGLNEVKIVSSQSKLLTSDRNGLRASISYWRKKKMIEEKKGVLSINENGMKKVYEEFPVWKKIDKKWSREWTFLTFDLPIKNRNRRSVLRLLLDKYKFGLFQQSVFVSPFGFRTELEKILEDKQFLKFETLLFSVPYGGVKIPIRKIWHLDNFDRKYKELLGGRENSFKQKRHLLEKFIKIKEEDVCLPEEINPIHKLEEGVEWKLTCLVKLL